MSIYKINLQEIISIHKSASIFEAVKLMKENNIGDIVVVDNENSTPKRGVRRAPIVDDNNQLCGIATIDDLLILIADELSSLAKLVRKQTKH